MSRERAGRGGARTGKAGLLRTYGREIVLFLLFLLGAAAPAFADGLRIPVAATGAAVLVGVGASLAWWPKGRSAAGRRFLTGLTAILLLNIGVRLTGGLGSPLWPGYNVLMALAAFWPEKVLTTGGLFFLVALLETVNVLALGPLPLPVSVLFALLTQLFILGLTAVIVGRMAWTHFGWAHRVKEEHEKLTHDAHVLEGMEPEGPGESGGMLSQDVRRIRWVGAVMELDVRMASILSLASLALEADHCGLFLVDGGGDQLVLKNLHPAAPDRGPVRISVSEGLVGGVARLTAPVVMGGLVPGDKRLVWLPARHAARSFAAAPIVYQGVVLGVFIADSARPDAFAVRKELLLGFAGQIGDIIHHYRDATRKEEEGRKYEALSLISNALASSLRESEIIETLLDRSLEMLGCRQVAFFLKNAEGNLVLKAARGLPPEMIGESFDVRSGLLGFLFTHRRPLLFDDLDSRSRQVPVVPRMHLKCRSLVAVPVNMEDQPAGIFMAADPQPGRFDTFHLESLSVLANQVAVMLANAALHLKVERMAVTDGLTGLYNHRYFHERLEQELVRLKRTDEPFSLLLLDIDHFKKVNDTWGHPFGDQVLKGVAVTLLAIAREADVVARYGGEEMAIMLLNTDRKGADTMARRVMDGVRNLVFENDGAKARITVSIGSSCWPGDGQTGTALVHAADEALYVSKKDGRDRHTAAGAATRSIPA